MKIGNLDVGDAQRPVLIVQNGIVDILKHAPDAPDTVEGLIRAYPTWRAQLEALASRTPDALFDSKLLTAPVTRPGKIFAIGLNYADHIAETSAPKPENQVWFTKAPTSVNAPYAPIELPAVSEALDYEAELVVVIGRTCRHVPRERVGEVVFGYCVGNDVSVRDWQRATTQWSLSKSFDRSAPIGPWITTSDEVDPSNLGIRSFVNGELRQNSNTKHLIFKIEDMIVHLSKAMTLEPGDLIFTGTPGGVGLTWKGRPHYLKVGDVSRVEIDGLGAIEAKVETGSGEFLLR